MTKDKISKRGDTFYYIEVWGAAELRDLKLSEILGSEEVKPLGYYYGSSVTQHIHQNIDCALFWKSYDTTYNRLRILQQEFLDLNHREVKYHYKIKNINREEFINIIKLGKKYKGYTEGSGYLKNINLCNNEIHYKKRIEQLEVQKDI